MSSLAKTFYTPEQYLGLERDADYKSEYLSGEIFATAGATRDHALIVTNIVGELSLQFKRRPCTTYSSDLRLAVNATGLYTYPDVIAVCGEAKFLDSRLDTLVNPTVIIEVLSSSTEAYDRGEKFAHYRRLESLTDYVLVAQNRFQVEHFEKQSDGHWLFTEANGPDESIFMASVDARLLLSEVYDKVDFEPPPSISDQPALNR